ncbi:MAG TPA: discoidin domain-containing protein [Caulobacteraceae bacterium]
MIGAVLLGAAAPARAPIATITIDPTPAGPAFHTDQALGAGIDGMPAGAVDELFTPHNIAWMRRAGLKPLTYRLRTELAIEAWHWGGEGTWSDPAHARGYWTSSDDPKAPIQTSWGYRLPRRGDTIDQANDTGYSRLDDGDDATFWKSNPYLDRHYTGEAEEGPQWVVVCLDAPAAIDAARIAWAAPHARRFAVQYWTGVDEYDDQGAWAAFPMGAVQDGQGGTGVIRLADKPVRARFLRILLEEGSHTAPASTADPHAADPRDADPRDAMGYAIGEVGFGTLGFDGALRDVVRHGPGRHGQSVIYVSSTDPWHRAVDKDLGLEQPGFDRLYRSGLTNGLPVMIPVGALYDTPQNAAAEIRFLRRRGYPIARVELGEEPDGQNVAAEDFARLFSQFAAAVHAIDPTLQTGGPSLQDGISDVWLQPGADRSWTHRFIAALAARGQPADLGFFSFERYPYDVLCGDMAAKLRNQNRGLAQTWDRLKADGVPQSIPWFVTEYGFSAMGGQAEDDLPGGLVNADIAAQSLQLGAAGAFLFGYGPNRPYAHANPCAGNGELMLLEADDEGQARWALPTFHGAAMLTADWAGPGGRMLTAHSPVRAPDGTLIVAAYAVKRADGRVAVLLLNRDPGQARAVRLDVAGSAATGPLAVTQYGPDQYLWRPAGTRGQPARTRPPTRYTLPNTGAILRLPPYSVTVVEVPAP